MLIQTPEIFFYEKLITEGRSVDRYPLVIDPASKKRLLSLIKLYSGDSSELGRYFFSHRNCAYMLGWLLSKSGLHLSVPQMALGSVISSGFSPDNLLHRLQAALLLPWPPMTMLSLNARFAAIAQKFKLNFGSVLDKHTKQFAPWNDDEFNAFDKMSLEELQIVIQSVYYVDKQRFESLNGIIKRNSGGQLRPLDWIKFKSLPNETFTLCDNLECLTSAISKYQAVNNLGQGFKNMNLAKLFRAQKLLQSVPAEYLRYWSLFQQ